MALLHLAAKRLIVDFAGPVNRPSMFSREAHPSEGHFGSGKSDLGARKDARNSSLNPKSEIPIPKSA
jgi:hypothetical protein